ncbi:MAG: sialidase family protein [Acidimicrobiales bacterium]
MLVDPANPRIIVAATAQLRTKVCYLVRSTDAGSTWHILDALPGPASYPYCTSGNAGVAIASLAWGRHNTLYYARLGYGANEGGRKNGHASIVLARSTNLGDSFSTTLVDNNRGKTGVSAPSDDGVCGLAVDTSGSSDVVYVGFVQSFPNAPKGSPLQDGKVEVAVSADGGASFSPGVSLDAFNHLTQVLAKKSYPLIMKTFFGAPFIAAHDGVVEVVDSAVTPSTDSPPGSSYYPLPPLVARSTDRGRTWSVKALGPPVFTATGAQTAMGWTSKGGPHGTFLAAYSATPATSATSGWEDVVLQRSTDEGVTWSAPVVINDDPPQALYTSFYPEMGIAPDGRVDVVFEDNRKQANDHFLVGYTYSLDGGLTWSHNVQVTDQPINFQLGVSYNGDIRQPPGVASADAYAAIGWADARLGDVVNQNQDDFVAMAQLAPLAPASSGVLYLLVAIFGGLIAAAAIVILLLVVRPRRSTKSG